MAKFKRPEFIFVFIAFWVILECAILGPYSYLRVFDIGNIHIPQNIIVAKNFWQWGASYWYPYSLGGIDLMAEGYRATNINYMSLFYYFLPAGLAYPFWMFLMVFIGGTFTYRLGREHLWLSEAGSFFAGISLACISGFWAVTAISLLPLVLFFLNKIHERCASSIRHGVWVFPLGLLFASGSLFVFDHILFLLIPAWFLLVLRKGDRHFWMLYCLFVGTALLYYFPTLWAQFANAPASNRSDNAIDLWYQFQGIIGSLFLLHDYRPGHFLFPVLWSLGLLIALWKFKFQNKRFNGLLILFFSLVGAAYGLNIFSTLFQDKISFFRGVRFNYTLETLPVFYALAGAFAVDALGPWSHRRLKVIFAVLFLLTLTPKLWNLNRWLHGDSYANLFEKNELKMLADQFNKTNLFRVGSAHWGIFHPIVEAYGLEAVDGYVHLYPKRVQLFMNALLNYDVPVGNRVQLMSEKMNWNLLSLANAKYILSDGRSALYTPKYLEKNSLVVYLKPQNKKGLRENLEIFENKNALPRFFIARSPKFFERPEDLLEALRAVPDISVFKNYVFLEKEYERAIPFRAGDFQFANVEVMEYKPDRIRLALNVDGSGILVASNSYSPYWRVYVDGRERKIVPAYYAFWGVPVGPRDKEMVFIYDPPYRFF